MAIRNDIWRLILNHFQVFIIKIFSYFIVTATYKFNYIIGYYFTGDGAFYDKDKHLQITGRVDDVINVSGHRIGTAEIEDVLVAILLLYD